MSDSEFIEKNVRKGSLLHIVQQIPEAVVIYLILFDKFEWLYLIYLSPLIIFGFWFKYQALRLSNISTQDFIYLFILYLVMPIVILYHLYF